MTITLLHPSRGRADKALDVVDYWLKRSGLHPSTPFEYLVSVDFSDPQLDSYKELMPPESLWVADNKSVVDATNLIAQRSRGDILIYLSDDFKCPDNWGSLILKEFEGVTEPMLLKVDDCLQKFHVPVLTIPIMNRALYEKLGYFWNPLYKSMFVDEDLYWTAKKLGALKFAEHLKFPHEHVSIGKAENDETYRRSAANWEQGKAVFAKRKAAGFPL